MKRPKQKQLQDFTSIDTIYQTTLQTIQVKIDPAYAILASPTLSLQTAQTPYDIYEVLKVIYTTLDDDQEHLIMLVLNAARNITGYKLIASGGQDQVFVDVKLLFRNALLLGATGIILAHNHPSGQLEPSAYDLELTQRAIVLGQMLDMEILDHIIYTNHSYTSIRHTHPTLFAQS